jgi:hypothetical protein
VGVSTGAERMAEVRLRQRLGLSCYIVELHDSEVADDFIEAQLR